MKKTRKSKLVAKSTAFETGRKTIPRNQISIMDDDQGEELVYDPQELKNEENHVKFYSQGLPVEVVDEINDHAERCCF